MAYRKSHYRNGSLRTGGTPGRKSCRTRRPKNYRAISSVYRYPAS